MAAFEAGPLPDLAWTAAVARSHFDYREAVPFRDISSLRQGLRQVSDSPPDVPHPSASRVAFAFTGQGNQWVGMGESLYRTEPVFRAVLDRCDQLIHEERGTSLLDVMFGRPGAAGELDEPRWTQPAIYALECALTALWESLGIHPDVVVGHSLGEIAAAQAAGVFTLEEGMKFASARGRLMGDLPGAGAMAAVFAPASQVETAVNEFRGEHPGAELCIGVDNGAHQVVSGPAEEVGALCDLLEQRGINLRRLRPSPAYHSPLVEPALDALEAVFEDIVVRPPGVPLVSNINGQPIGPDQPMDGAYWRQHARRPVAFRQCVETLAELGADAVIEIGPHAILGPLVSLNWPQPTGPASGPASGSAANPVSTPLVLQSLLRPTQDGSEPEREDAFLHAVAGAYRAGLPVELAALFAGEERRRIPVPGYPFQRRRYWVNSAQRQRSGDSHPLLGEKHESPRGETMFEIEMSPSDPAWLIDHQVFGRVVMPGAVYGAMAASLPFVEGATTSIVEELQLHNPLVYPEFDAGEDSPEPSRRIQLIVDGKNGKGARTEPRRFEVFSKGEEDEEWTLHAEGQLAGPARPAGPGQGCRPGVSERISRLPGYGNLLPGQDRVGH